MNMTHPNILQAERTGYPSRPKIETEPYLCDCGTQTISPINCTVCGHTGCRKCMVYDGEAAEWFCGLECVIEYYKDENERLQDELKLERELRKQDRAEHRIALVAIKDACQQEINAIDKG